METPQKPRQKNTNPAQPLGSNPLKFESSLPKNIFNILFSLKKITLRRETPLLDVPVNVVP